MGIIKSGDFIPYAINKDAVLNGCITLQVLNDIGFRLSKRLLLQLLKLTFATG
jgi:hypothetical protein